MYIKGGTLNRIKNCFRKLPVQNYNEFSLNNKEEKPPKKSQDRFSEILWDSFTYKREKKRRPLQQNQKSKSGH